MIKFILLIIIGFVFLIKGADFLVEGASSIAKKFRIPEIIIGLTIVSIGTSMPEFFVSLTSAMQGFSDVSLGNVIGSNLCNLLLILGITTIIRSVKFAKNTKIIEIPFLIVITFIFFVLAQNRIISKANGVVLVGFFIIFILYTIVSAKKQKIDESNSLEIDIRQKEISVLKSILKIIIGIVALKLGGEFVVNNATEVAKIIGISEKIISVTIIAVGTSLPELVTSVFAAIKGNTDMAIGNIIGSNIFNLLLIIGVSCIISPLNYNPSYNLDLIILFIASLSLFIIPKVGKKDYMTKKGGLLFLLSYIGYIAHLIVI